VGSLARAVSAAGRPGEDCEIGELLCQAIAQAADADAALHGKLSRVGLPAGAVTEADLFAVVPYENTIGTALLTRAELREILAEQLAKRKSYVYCGLWGVEAVLGADGEVKRISLPASGRPDGRVKVALNSYTIAGAGGRFPRLRAILRTPQAQLRDSGINSRDAVRDFLKKNEPLDLRMRSWLTRERR